MAWRSLRKTKRFRHGTVVNGENRVRSASVVFVASKLRKLRGWFFVLVVRMVVVMAVVMMANVCTNGKSAAKGGDLLRANENKKI
jgi:hypothetical protein